MARAPTLNHRPFSVVLGGGGARGFAHLGVLRALERDGLRPSGVVGVSMGGVVGGAFSHRSDWYHAVLAMDISAFPGPAESRPSGSPGWLSGLRRLMSFLRAANQLLKGWGPGTSARIAGLRELRKLFDYHGLDDGRIPLAVCATDLFTGQRVVIRSGDAVNAVYASAALAGVLPPLESEGFMLSDGAYTDLAPVDVARALVPGPVVAVDPGQPSETRELHNGFQAIMRAMEICHRRHADLRFAKADMVLRPQFRRTIETLDFHARRECVAAGIRVVRQQRPALHGLLFRASDLDDLAEENPREPGRTGRSG